MGHFELLTLLLSPPSRVGYGCKVAVVEGDADNECLYAASLDTITDHVAGDVFVRAECVVELPPQASAVKAVVLLHQVAAALQAYEVLITPQTAETRAVVSNAQYAALASAFGDRTVFPDCVVRVAGDSAVLGAVVAAVFGSSAPRDLFRTPTRQLYTILAARADRLRAAKMLPVEPLLAPRSARAVDQLNRRHRRRTRLVCV